MREYAVGTTFDLKFTTRRFSTGAPHTLAGTPAVAAYPDNSTTEITAGITLSVDFDSRTGLNNVRVVATGANGYAAGVTYHLVVTAGTVDSVSVVGEVVGEFSLGAQTVNANLVSFDSWRGLAQTGTLSTTQATTDLTGFGDDLFNHRWYIYWGTGSSREYQLALVTDYASASGLLTWAPALSGAPANNDPFVLIPAATGLAVGDRTGALSGAVGSVTAAVTAGTVTDKTGYSLSAAGIQAIWDALTAALTTANSIGKLLVDNINATISSRASQTSVDTVDDFLDTEIAAIKAKTDNLPADPADASDIAASFTTLTGKVDTIDDFLDTEVAAIKAKTDQLTFTAANKVDATLQAAGDLAAAVGNKIADMVLRRNLANARASANGDTVDFRSTLGAASKLVNRVAVSGSDLLTYEEDDTTTFGTQAITTDGTADPITELNTT